MRRVAIAVMSTISGLVLLFSYHTSQGPGGGGSVAINTGSGNGNGGGIPPAVAPGASAAGPDPASDASPSPSSSSSSSPSSSSGASSSGAGSSGSAAAATYTGDEVQTRWGPVKVQIVVQNSKIIKVAVLEYPDGNGHDLEINSYALPQLQQETIQASSAQIDAVSGATVTSGGYIASLQSAVDQAHL